MKLTFEGSWPDIQREMRAFLGLPKRDEAEVVMTVRNVYMPEGQKIQAIKFVREAMGLTLVEAKRFVENECEWQSPPLSEEA